MTPLPDHQSALSLTLPLSITHATAHQQMELALRPTRLMKKLQRVLSYENAGEAALVGIELEILGHDRVYEEAILAAGEMVMA